MLRATVQRASGGWVISFTVQRSPKQRRARRPNAVVGVDLGLTRLVTLSTGDTAANTRPLQAALRSLRRLQRRLDRQRRANNPGNYYADGRVKRGPKTWAKSARMSAPSSGSPSSTRGWRTCAASRHTSSLPRSYASSA